MAINGQIAKIILLLTGAITQSIATDIATFSDASCNDSLENISGPNGYPNGTCTELDIKGSFQSFMLVGRDSGCGVTLYSQERSDVDPCSADAIMEAAEDAQCYNATWIYYSIDFCDPPGSTIIASPSSSSTPSPSSSSASSLSSSSTSATGTKKVNTGAIAGGTVGGVLGAALLAGTGFFFWRRRRRPYTTNPGELDDATVYSAAPKTMPPGAGPPIELSSGARYELGTGKDAPLAQLEATQGDGQDKIITTSYSKFSELEGDPSIAKDSTLR